MLGGSTFIIKADGTCMVSARRSTIPCHFSTISEGIWIRCAMANPPAKNIDLIGSCSCRFAREPGLSQRAGATGDNVTPPCRGSTPKKPRPELKSPAEYHFLIWQTSTYAFLTRRDLHVSRYGRPQ